MSKRIPAGLLPLLASAALAGLLIGCLNSNRGATNQFKTKPGAPLTRSGDEIVACGQLFHIGTPVVLWMDPGGYDAYRVEKRFGPFGRSSWDATTQSITTRAATQLTPNRYSDRNMTLATQPADHVREGNWALPQLQNKVDQFVIHFDECGTSQVCFRVLQDQRNLSVHFMLDLDGTIYQTLDLKERARQATKANDRSIGIEIANMGCYSMKESQAPLLEWYSKDPAGDMRITIPARLGNGGIRTPNFVGHPARGEMIVGEIQHRVQRQYDYTPQQYSSLIKLTAALCRIFPKIRCDYPRDENGNLIPYALTDDQFNFYTGVLGHYHVQTNKSDPGPAFQWDLVINGARELLNQKPLGTMTAQASQ